MSSSMPSCPTGTASSSAPGTHRVGAMWLPTKLPDMREIIEGARENTAEGLRSAPWK